MLFRDFGTDSYDDSTNCQNLLNCGSISPKTVLNFPKNFLDFRFESVEKQSIINLSSYSSRSYASVVLCYSPVTYLGEGRV